MGRFSRAWSMAKTSLRVVRQDPELGWLPVLSFLASLVAIAAVTGVGWGAGVTPQIQGPDGSVDPVAAGLAFLTYILLAFVQVFFYAAMVAGAHERLSGGDPTVGSALRKAGSHVGVLFLWSVVVATVNVLLQILRERSGAVGRLASQVAGVAWNFATYFVVPLLMFEDLRVGGALKRSGGLFKKTWGEQVIGEVGLGLVSVAATFVAVLVGVGVTIALATLGTWGMIVGLVLGVILVLGVVVLFQVANAVYKTALFRYATEGHAGGPFDDAALAGTFHR